ncbi:MAG: nitroreductase family protein [Thermodesulfobacteriota bacterium]
MVAVLVFAIGSTPTALAGGVEAMKLPEPVKEGGKPLMSALKERRTTRSFSNTKLSAETLSNLLWAAFGINRPDGKRTAPSAWNWQETSIYVTSAEGAFLWDAQKNTLEKITSLDLRALTGSQNFVNEAAVNLVYVVDYAKLNVQEEDLCTLVGADVGMIAENVCLFCASEGLATVVRAGVQKEELSKALGLDSRQKPILAQSVGYPGKGGANY